jgi:hypothetical protein
MKVIPFYEVHFNEVTKKGDRCKSALPMWRRFDALKKKNDGLSTLPENIPMWRNPSFLNERSFFRFTKYVNKKSFKIPAKTGEVLVKLYDSPRILSGGIRVNSYRGCLSLKNTSNKNVYVEKYTILESLFDILDVEMFTMM